MEVVLESVRAEGKQVEWGMQGMLPGEDASSDINRGGDCGNLRFTADWSEARLTTWTCGWHRKQGGSLLAGPSPWPVGARVLCAVMSSLPELSKLDQRSLSYVFTVCALK